MAKISKALFQLWPQWFASLTVSLLIISNGLAIGWTSPYLAQLTGEFSPFHVTYEEGSWIVSLFSLGRFLGSVIGYLTLEYTGSKMSVLLSGFPMILSWICVTCATSSIWLYVSKIFSGISMGMTFNCFQFYVSEISAPSIRGALVSQGISAISIGIFIGTIMGPNMSMMYYGIISLIPTLCFMGIFSFLPQSPHYCVRRNDTKRAEQAIRWYYRKSDVISEIEAIEHFVKSTQVMSIRKRWKQIKEPKIRRSFIMITFLFIFMHLATGFNNVLFYMEIIVRDGMVTSIMPTTVVIIINAIYIIQGWIGIFAIDYCGRKILLVISSFGVMFGMILLGLHFFLLDCKYDPGNFEWLMILSLLMLTLMAIGLEPVPYTLLSEIFPSDLKSVAGFVGSIVSAVFAFIASITYQPLVDLISEKYVFWIYAVIGMISLIYSFTIPETKGKTLQEIQDMLAARNAPTRSQEKAHIKTGNIQM